MACPDQSLKTSECCRSTTHPRHGMRMSRPAAKRTTMAAASRRARWPIISTMTERVELGDAAEVPEGGLKAFKTGDTMVVVARVGDRYCAVHYKCPHMGRNLGRGRVEAGAVVCPVHGSGFDMCAGAVLDCASKRGGVRLARAMRCLLLSVR